MGSLIGPLTTTFIAPTICPTSFSNTYVDERGVLAIGPLRKHAECFPKDFVAVRDFYYSPGVCPSGYETACSGLKSAGTVTETGVTCCPRSFTCQTDTIFPEQITFGCVSRTGVTWTFPTLTVLSSGEPVSVTSSAFTDPLGNTGGVNAFSIQIRYQSTDFTTPTITSALTSTATSQATNTGNTTSETSSSTGLSTAAAVGAGVGSAIGVLLIAGIIFFFYRDARRKRRELLQSSLTEAAPQDAKEGYTYGGPPKLGQQQTAYELIGGAQDQRVELAAQQRHHQELPADEHKVWELPVPDGQPAARRDA